MRFAAAILAIIAIAPSPAAASPLLPKAGFVQANGIRLQYLDWGGSGDLILFLPASMTPLMFTIISRHVLLTASTS